MDLSEPAPQRDPRDEIEDILREAQSVRWAVGASEPVTPEAGDDARPPGGPRVLPPLRAVRAQADVRFDTSQHVPGVVTVERAPEVHVSPLAWVAIGLGVLTALVWFKVLADGSAPAPPKLDPVYAEASLRHAMAVTIRRIDEFESRYGRAPATLTEVGQQPWPPITYEQLDVRRYRLVAAGPNNPVEYDSITPLESFLGNSPEFLGPESEATP